MIELSVLTLGKLVDIQLADLSTFVERQNVSMHRIIEVRDVAAMLALQREYSDGYWKDRANALTAAKDAIQVASQRVGKSWTEMVNAYEASPTPSGVPRLRDTKSGSKQKAKRSKEAKEVTLVPAVTTSPTRPKAQLARSESSKGSAPGQAHPRPEQAAARTIAKKRRTRARKGRTRAQRPPPVGESG
ncbi:MAG: hypothetical protein ABW110_23710 [Steroidobacteraceae bacterium]